MLTRRQSFLPWIERGAFDIVQPDCTKVGGLSEARRIGWMAHDHNVLLVPHGWNTAVGLAADLHLVAALPVARWVEYLTPSPFIEEIITTPFALDAEGSCPSRPAPGLGIELDPQGVARYAGGAHAVSAPAAGAGTPGPASRRADGAAGRTGRGTRRVRPAADQRHRRRRHRRARLRGRRRRQGRADRRRCSAGAGAPRAPPATSGRDGAAVRVVDVAGRCVSPGWVDFHGHADWTCLDHPAALNLLIQGCTLTVAGNCGLAPGAGRRPGHGAAAPGRGAGLPRGRRSTP